MKNSDIKKKVREVYGKIATNSSSCCCSSSCCGSQTLEESTENLGYSKEDIKGAPEDSNLGLGCGNPHLFANLKPGETVLDLGSGAGFDCFLAAKAVKDSGYVIGIDMTPEMIKKANENLGKTDYKNVEFRHGTIESMPVKDNSIDVVISNCVINLSTEKKRVYKEIYRVLKKNGRVSISDIVAKRELPDKIKDDIAMHAGCISGAEEISKIKEILKDVGFKDISITSANNNLDTVPNDFKSNNVEDYIFSAYIEAYKP